MVLLVRIKTMNIRSLVKIPGIQEVKPLALWVFFVKKGLLQGPGVDLHHICNWQGLNDTRKIALDSGLKRRRRKRNRKISNIHLLLDQLWLFFWLLDVRSGVLTSLPLVFFFIFFPSNEARHHGVIRIPPDR